MAISGTLARLLVSIKPILPRGGSLLEIGEANWYGDTIPDFPCRNDNLHDIAKDFYAALFAPGRIVSIDADGTPDAIRYDLNEPIPSRHDTRNEKCPGNSSVAITGCDGFLCLCPGRPIDEIFDISINHGTAEHVFNIAQVFRTMHGATMCGGLMIHESPFIGWIDHGFYCLQPTLFYDLAAENCYEIVTVAVEEIQSQTIIRLDHRDHATQLAAEGKLPNNSMLFVVFRKLTDRPFRIPMQGYYARRLSHAGMKAWGDLR